MVSRICLSSTRRSVTTMTESKTGCAVASSARPAGGPARRWSCSCRCRPSAGSGSACPAPCACGVGQQLAHHVELVVAREDLRRASSCPSSRPSPRRPGRSSRGCRSGLAGVRISLPEVVGLQAVGIGRVAGAVVPALVERQEPGRPCPSAAVHMRTSLVVHGEVDDAAAELEEQLAAGRGRAGTARRRRRRSAWSGCSSARRWRPAGR